LGFFAALNNPTYGIIFSFCGWRVLHALAAFSRPRKNLQAL